MGNGSKKDSVPENEVNQIIDLVLQQNRGKCTYFEQYHHGETVLDGGLDDILPTLLGSSNKTNVRDFRAQDAYHGAKVEDFIERGNYILKAAVEIVQKKIEEEKSKSSVNQETIDKLNQHIKDLNMLHEQFVQLVLAHASFDPRLNKTRNGQVDLQHFEEKYEFGLKALKTLVVESSILIDVHPKLIQNVLKEITRREGRDNDIHIYPVQATVQGRQTTHTRVSSARTTSKETIPSNIRRRDKLSNETPLSNNVRRDCGILEQTAEGEFRYIEEYTGLTHSSYTPIADWSQNKDKVENLHHRLRYAAKGVQADIEEIIQHGQVQQPDNGPKKIKLSVNSLFTSLNTRLERAGRRSESENRQLEESWLALQMYHGQTIKIDGENYLIEVDTMNVPSNLTGIMGELRHAFGPSDIEKHINERSLHQVVKNIDQYFTVSEHDSHARRQAKAVIKELLMDFSPEEKDQMNSLQQSIQSKEERLRYRYEFLRRSLLEESYGGDANTKQQKIEEVRKEILSLEKDLGVNYKELNELYMESYQKNMSKIIGGIELLKQTMAVSADKELLQLFDVAELNANLLDMMSHQSQQDPNLSYQLSAVYNITSYKMGFNSIFYCKSAEDRTGRVGEKIEEILSFRRAHGYYPSTSDSDQEKLNDLSHEIHEFSVHKQVTTRNDRGARGLQIQSGTGNQHLYSSVLDNKMGKTAKRVFEEVTSMYVKRKFSKAFGLKNNLKTFEQRLLESLELENISQSKPEGFKLAKHQDESGHSPLARIKPLLGFNKFNFHGSRNTEVSDKKETKPHKGPSKP